MKGDPSLKRSLITLKSMMKTIPKMGRGVLIELNRIEVEVEEKSEDILKDILNELTTVIKQFAGTFDMPPRLPPKRFKQHSIILKDETNPISVRPYSIRKFKRWRLRGWWLTCCKQVLYNLLPVLSQARYSWLRKKMGRGDFASIIGLSTRK